MALGIATVEVPVRQVVRLSLRPLTEPWWFRDAAHRFDDPQRDFGVCYGADSIETAFCESILWAGAPVGAGYSVSEATLLAREVVGFRLPRRRRMLQLADLTGDSLKRMGLNNDISASSDYATTQALARRLYHDEPSLDGIQYVSRQRNTHRCYAIFDRSGLQRARHAPLAQDWIARACASYGVTLLPDV